MAFLDRGSASLEFTIVALGVLFPLVALTVSTTSLQRAQFAATEIARQGVRAVALAPTLSEGKRAVKRISQLALEDFGISDTTRFVVACEPASCRTRGSLIRLTVIVPTSLVMIPALPWIDVPNRIPVTATATHRAPLPVMP